MFVKRALRMGTLNGIGEGQKAVQDWNTTCSFLVRHLFFPVCTKNFPWAPIIKCFQHHGIVGSQWPGFAPINEREIGNNTEDVNLLPKADFSVHLDHTSCVQKCFTRIAGPLRNWVLRLTPMWQNRSLRVWRRIRFDLLVYDKQLLGNSIWGKTRKSSSWQCWLQGPLKPGRDWISRGFEVRRLATWSLEWIGSLRHVRRTRVCRVLWKRTGCDGRVCRSNRLLIWLQFYFSHPNFHDLLRE